MDNLCSTPLVGTKGTMVASRAKHCLMRSRAIGYGKIRKTSNDIGTRCQVSDSRIDASVLFFG